MSLKNLIKKTVLSAGPVLGILAMTNFVGVKNGMSYNFTLADRASKIPGCEVRDIERMSPYEMEEFFQNMREIKEIHSNRWSPSFRKDIILLFESTTGKIIQCQGNDAIKKLFNQPTQTQIHDNNNPDVLRETQKKMHSARDTINSITGTTNSINGMINSFRWLSESVKRMGK